MSDIRTHGDSPKTYAGKKCRCNRCGVVETCRPSFDFYTRTSDGHLGPLFCYPCLLADAAASRNAGYQTTTFTLN